MKLVVDVCLSPEWIKVLAEGAHDAVHWQTVGAFDATDAQIMAWALANKRIVFTHDLDFGTILAASGVSGPSVVQLWEQDVDPERMGTQVLRALGQFATQLEAGAIITIDFRRAKATVLPLTTR